MVEHLRLATLCGWDEVGVEDFQDVFADLGEFGFDLLAVFLDEADLGIIAL